MFAASLSATFTQAIGIALGIAFVVGLFYLLARQRENRRKASAERAPVRHKLLRPPGHWLANKVAHLDDTLTTRVMATLAAGACLGLCLTGLFPVAAGLILGHFTLSELSAHPDSSIFLVVTFLSIAILGWLVRSFSRLRITFEQLRHHRFGLRGEQAVAEALANPALAAVGCITFHDVPGDGDWNIDHIVIGSGGIIVLETKTCAKRKACWEQDEHVVEYDGRVLRFPWRVDCEAVRQVSANAEWLGKHLQNMAILPPGLPIIPVLVIPGWMVTSKGNYPVKAMPETYLTQNFLLTLPRRFAASQLEPIIRLLDQRCRTLEF